MARCWVSEASDAGYPVWGGGGWLGFWLFDYWIVDASNTHVVVPGCFRGSVGAVPPCVCVLVCSVVYRFVT